MAETNDPALSHAKHTALSRRKFFSTASVASATLAAVTLAGAPTSAAAQAQMDQPVPREPATPFPPEQLPQLSAPTEQQTPPPPTPLAPNQRVGYAVVGLGTLALQEILPAFGQCKKSRLVAVVSGDPAKATRVAAEHGLTARQIYSYDTFDQIRDNPEIEVVYIVLPNGLHEQYTLRSAAAGKHVLCEKPMANNSAQARNMINACNKANRRLMIAYRIQYEPHHRMARAIVREQQYGAVKVIEAVNTQNQGDPNQWRQKLALAGGGSLPDIGLYCLNTIRFILGEEPIEIQAAISTNQSDPRFKEVEDNVVWQMRFPSGVLTNSLCSYSTHRSNRYRIHMDNGWVNLDPAFVYDGLQMEVAYATGNTENVEQRRIQSQNQFALEIDHMSDCVINDKRPFTPGEEGLQDHLLMEAIYKAARTHSIVRLKPVAQRDAFRGSEPVES